jgi:excisionase family DNA binding protein
MSHKHTYVKLYVPRCTVDDTARMKNKAMRKHSMDEQVFTVGEIAQRLRVDVKTVRKWIRKGELAAIDIGGEYRIRQSALDDFIQRRERRERPTET